MAEPTPFQLQCYALLKTIPAGRVTTYKALAAALNSRAWRAVGHAMAQNPHPVIVPCHRVVCSDGRLGGYRYGAAQKAALLRSEGIVISGNRIRHFAQVFFQFAAIPPPADEDVAPFTSISPRGTELSTLIAP